MPYGTLNVDKIVNDNGVTFAGLYGFKNRLINGDMRIDQRNAGASVTQTTNLLYTVDRFAVVGSVTSKFTAQQSTTAATGFSNSLLCTSSSAYTVGASEDFSVRHYIEGFNSADLGWGTANASAVTLSFWVRSSLTGTFGGAIANSAQDRFYVFSYTINAANTWEQKTITISGDTAGTWVTNNGIGIRIFWSLGAGATVSSTAGSWGTTFYRSATGAVSVVGTNGATFYITGVQLEKGSTATSFDYRPYGTELALCQRYYEKSYDIATTPGTSTDTGALLVICPGNINRVFGSIQLRVSKRGSPTYTIYSTTGASGNVRDITAAADKAVSLATTAGENGVGIVSTAGISAVTNTVAFQYTASAEL
jgi:hypothetical protein